MSGHDEAHQIIRAAYAARRRFRSNRRARRHDPTSPPIPAGAGSGQFGGFCQGQVASLLAGKKIDDYLTIDVTYRVELPAETAMSLSIFNLLDEDPSFARTAISYMSGFGNPLGRSVKLQLSKRF